MKRVRSKWQAEIMVQGHKIPLGDFDVEEDAARASDAARAEWAALLQRSKIPLNFPGEAPLASALAALPPLPAALQPPAPLPPRRRCAADRAAAAARQRVAVRFKDGIEYARARSRRWRTRTTRSCGTTTARARPCASRTPTCASRASARGAGDQAGREIARQAAPRAPRTAPAAAPAAPTPPRGAPPAAPKPRPVEARRAAKGARSALPSASADVAGLRRRAHSRPRRNRARRRRPSRAPRAARRRGRARAARRGRPATRASAAGSRPWPQERRYLGHVGEARYSDAAAGVVFRVEYTDGETEDEVLQEDAFAGAGAPPRSRKALPRLGGSPRNRPVARAGRSERRRT